MRRLYSLLATLLFALSTPSVAQYFVCGPNTDSLTVVGTVPYDAVFMSFTPETPNASQTVSIAVGMGHWLPSGAVAEVQGMDINVTLSARYFGLTTPPPPACISAIVGPLKTGGHNVNLFLINTESSNPTPILVGTGGFNVFARPPAIANSFSTRGTTLLTIAGSVGNGCLDYGPSTFLISGNSISLNTTVGPTTRGCPGVPPPGWVNVTVDVGVLPPGHYNATWTFSPFGYPATTTAQFDVFSAIPTLQPGMLIALGALLALGAVVMIRRRS